MKNTFLLAALLLAGSCRPRPVFYPDSHILNGNWLQYDSMGFTLIHIVDTASVLYYHFYVRGPRFYQCAGTLGYIDSGDIWIDTRYETHRFSLRGDSLLESNPLGPQVFVKMSNEDGVE